MELKSHQGLRMQAATSRWFGVRAHVCKSIILVLYVTLFFNFVEPVSGDEGIVPWTTFWTPPSDATVPYPPLRSLHVSGVNGDDFILFGGNHVDGATVCATAMLLHALWERKGGIVVTLLIYGGRLLVELVCLVVDWII